MASLPEAFITHVSQGRVRVKIPAKKNDREYFAQLKNFLAPLPGVVKVESNLVTASVLVLHSLDLKTLADLKTMADYSEMMGLFKLVEPDSVKTPQGGVTLGQGLAEGFAGLNQSVKGMTAGIVDLPTVAAVGLLGLGAWQVSRGEVAVPAITALWYAGTLLRDQLAESKKESQSEATH